MKLSSLHSFEISLSWSPSEVLISQWSSGILPWPSAPCPLSLGDLYPTPHFQPFYETGSHIYIWPSASPCALHLFPSAGRISPAHKHPSSIFILAAVNLGRSYSCQSCLSATWISEFSELSSAKAIFSPHQIPLITMLTCIPSFDKPLLLPWTHYYSPLTALPDPQPPV